jgi:hypothetical protein
MKVSSLVLMLSFFTSQAIASDVVVSDPSSVDGKWYSKKVHLNLFKMII